MAGTFWRSFAHYGEKTAPRVACTETGWVVDQWNGTATVEPHD